MNELKNYVENNPQYIKRKQSERYPDLYVLKYTRKCFYKNIWNKYTKMCRGLIVDKDYNIILEPMPKIFNYGIENNAPRISGDQIILAVRKINGFYCSVKYYKNEILISTTGSLDSKYCDMAKNMIMGSINQEYLLEFLSNGKTLYLEIVHPNDPHIISEKDGVYYLLHRYKNELTIKIHKELLKDSGFLIPESFILKFNDIKKRVKTVKHEGYVIHSKEGMTKIKSPYYLVAKLLARCKDVKELLKNNIKNRVDEEYFGLIDYIKKDVENFACISEQERLQYIRNYFENLLI